MDTWVSYQIHPETPPAGHSLAEYFRGADLTPMHEMLRARTAEFGLPFSAPQVLANSRLAILAAEHARDTGRHEALSRRLFSAYFAESLNIGDVEVLTALGVEVGLDPEALRDSLATDAHVDRLAEAERQARRLGITGVPTFFIASAPPGSELSPRLRIVGAQPIAVFRSALNND